MTRQKQNSHRVKKIRRRDMDEAAFKENEFSRLKRKLRIMANDTQNYTREVNFILRKQGKEIKFLGKENAEMQESLSVAYGNYHLAKDISHTRVLKEMLQAREDYKHLTDVEINACKELDVKISALQEKLNEAKKDVGGEIGEHAKMVASQHYITRLENTVCKLNKDFCSRLNQNEKLKEAIVLLLKEKKVYQDLYNKLTTKIAHYKNKIIDLRQEASSHYDQRLEAMGKMKTLKERSAKDEALFQGEMKILQRMIAHDEKLKEFMSTKENERLNFKAEEAEKRAKMSIKEKALNEETGQVQKFENLFENVREVTAHTDLEKVVNEFTDKDEENFARFDYVSELNNDVEKLREEIDNISNSIKRLKDESSNIGASAEKTCNELRKTLEKETVELDTASDKQSKLDNKLEMICGAVYMLFKKISCSTDPLKMKLAFEEKVSTENLKTYLGIIEQRFLEMISITQFIGLHQDQHGNILSSPRSIHKLRPRGASKIYKNITTDQPVTPSVNTPNIPEEHAIEITHLEEISTTPVDIGLLREVTLKRIAKKEAAGLLKQPMFIQDKHKRTNKKK